MIDQATMLAMGNQLMEAVGQLGTDLGANPPSAYAHVVPAANNLLYALEQDAGLPGGSYGSTGGTMPDPIS